MKKKKPEEKKRHRSSVSGKFVNPLFAAMFPQYTVSETIKK